MNARLTIPSTQSLIAFEQVSRMRSFTTAADVLNLTQGAVSKQVRALEIFLGTTLFSRTRQGLVLTAEGERYLAEVAPHLEGLANAGKRVLRPRGTTTPLRVRGLATLNDRWLMPRLGAFLSLRPDIRIEFSTVLLVASHAISASDLEIRFGQGDWPDVTSHYLTGADHRLVASPGFVSKHGNLSPPGAISVLEWPRYEHMQALQIWDEFMAAEGVPLRQLPTPAARHEVYSVLISAVVSGLATALVPRCLITADLASGVLTNPAGLGLRSRLGYYLCWPQKQGLRPEAKVFVDWLIAEAKADEIE